MSTDGSILLGLAAQYDGELKVVGEEFSEERIGIGYSPDAPEMCQWITDVIQESYDNGDWEAAFEETLGASGSETPEPAGARLLRVIVTDLPGRPSAAPVGRRSDPRRADPAARHVTRGAAWTPSPTTTS